MMCSPFTSIPPSKQKSAEEGPIARPRAFRESGTPSDRGRRAKSFLQRFTQAKNIAVKKCASIISYSVQRKRFSSFSHRFRSNSRSFFENPNARHTDRRRFLHRARQRHSRTRDGR